MTDEIIPIEAHREEPMRAADAIGRPSPVGSGSRQRWAMCASLTEDLLNDLVLFAIGAGVALEPATTKVTMPGAGEVDVRLALTVTGAQFRLSADDGGRARVVVSALGDVSVEDGPGTAGSAAMPNPPAAIPVRLEALVVPVVHIGANHVVTLGLDLASAEFVTLGVDTEATVPDGVDPTAWAGVLQMFGMVFGVMGAQLFGTLGEHVGAITRELGPEVGDVLAQLGVAQGAADVSVATGLLSIGLSGTEDVSGRATPVPVAGKRIGLGMATSAVDALAHLLIERVAGDLPVPFELEVGLGEQRVGGRIRQARVLPEQFPDIRSALRTEIRPRLVRGRLELSVQSAWIELPPALPSVFNLVSRRLGELASLAPLRVRFPAVVQIPVDPETDDTIGIEVDDLRVTSDGIGVVVGLA